MRQLRTPFSDARAPATATATALLSATPSAATWSPTTARKSSPGMATPEPLNCHLQVGEQRMVRGRRHARALRHTACNTKKV